ncbi:recombinase family protein [Streptomyces himalayensis]|uniref:Recombinase family protein n=1 Tax=Streptomyces himalayensis subsp. himalayensis TaxID=2756131 RepID=A0A7W0ID71_9ACTN|nr:recombinase family protein [Streptomyces himalayensis]MBA2951470.1 recombinase family protein [Streptomyces himalayensis subsp. himalayensis]
MPVPVGTYYRISEDMVGDAKGVKRQREDCLNLARLRRWDPVQYEDNDLSAYKPTVVRPDFEQMLKDLDAGIIKGIVVYDLDRFTRQPRELERTIEIYDRHPGLIFASLQGDINLMTSDGRTMARVLVAFANKASADTARRVKRKQEELAVTEVKLVHGGRVPYGWMPDGETADPEAKKEILKAHERIMAGDRIHEIRDDWLARDVIPRSRSGKRFGKDGGLQHSTVTRVLTNPALAGIKVYRGEVLREEHGSLIKGSWEAICTPERLEEVTAELEGRTPPRNPNVTPYLLSGIARCGKCTGPMRGQYRKDRKGNRVPAYCCHQEKGGCGGISRKAEPIDELIISLVLADEERVKSKVTTKAPTWEGEAELAEVQGEIRELIQAKNDKKISVSTLIQLMPDLETKRDRLLAEQRRARAARRTAEVISTASRDAFDALPTIERQRARILQSIQAVIIHPAGKGAGPKFNPDLIEPIWA